MSKKDSDVHAVFKAVIHLFLKTVKKQDEYQVARLFYLNLQHKKH